MVFNKIVFQVLQLDFNAFAPKTSCNLICFTHLQTLTNQPSIALKIVPQANFEMQSCIFSLSLCHLLSEPADWNSFWKSNIKYV